MLLEKSNNMFNGKYTYPNLHEEYKTSDSKITILCHHHGMFVKTAKRHFAQDKSGICPLCKKDNKPYSMTGEYLSIFSEMKLRLLRLDLNGNTHQDIECLLCGNIFNATPKSKVTNYRNHGQPGCPKCTSDATYKNSRELNVQSLKEKFDFNTDISNCKFTNITMVTVQNKKCKHVFTSKIGNLINRNVTCPICYLDVKRDEYNHSMHYNSLVNKTDIATYKSQVKFLTEKNYKDNVHIINPNNYPRVLAGNDGYQLDHIVSIMLRM